MLNGLFARRDQRAWHPYQRPAALDQRTDLRQVQGSNLSINYLLYSIFYPTKIYKFVPDHPSKERKHLSSDE